MADMVTKIVPFRALLDFSAKVAEMREAQEEWRNHKNRPENLLHKARGLERSIDRLCDDLAAEQYRTGSLFGTPGVASPPVALIESVASCCDLLAKVLSMPAGKQAAALKYVADELKAKSKEFQEWK